MLETEPARVGAERPAEGVLSVDAGQRLQHRGRAVIDETPVIGARREPIRGLRHRLVLRSQLPARRVHGDVAHPEPCKVDHRPGAPPLRHRLGLGVLVDALVEEGPRQLVRRDQAVKPLVAELVDRDDLGREHARRRPPGALGRDERRVLHAPGFGRVTLRVNDREDRVRVAAVARGEVRQGEAHRLQIAPGDVPEPRRVEHLHVDAVDRLAELLPPVPGRPREVVDVALNVALDPPAAVDPLLDGGPRRSDPEGTRHVERHVVGAEVRVELGQVVEREMRPPGLRPWPVLEPRDLGKPLADHVEAAAVAGPLDDDGQLVVEHDVERDRLAGRDLPRQGDACVGLVLVARGAASVRPPSPGTTGGGRASELGAWPQVDRCRVAVAVQGELLHVDPAPVFRRAAASPPDAFAKEGRALVLERVQVKVQPDFAHGLCARVAPADRAFAVHRVRPGVERRAQGVVDDVVGRTAQVAVRVLRRWRSDLRLRGSGWSGARAGDEDRRERPEQGARARRLHSSMIHRAHLAPQVHLFSGHDALINASQLAAPRRLVRRMRQFESPRRVRLFVVDRAEAHRGRDPASPEALRRGR